MTYNEWYEQTGQALWQDASVSTADILRAAWVSATIAEREACAQVCEELDSPYWDDLDPVMECAKQIRARGER